MQCITIGCENQAEPGDYKTCRRCRPEGMTDEAARRLDMATSCGAPYTPPSGPIICDTPGTIAKFTLLALRGALKLQSKGIKMSRGKSALTAVRSFGIKERTAAKAIERY